MFVAVIIILFCINNIRRVRSQPIDIVLSDVITGLSIIGIVTSIMSIFGDILQFIGIINIQTLTSIITWMVMNCNIIVTVLAGLILADRDYNLRVMIKTKFDEISKTHYGKKSQ